MYIFAKNAEEITDDKTPEKGKHNKYTDDSNNYRVGFGYDFDLNSALFNGFLHKISKRINEILKCDASKTPINTDRPSRYNSLSEVENPDYSDNENYVKNAHYSHFINSRIKGKLLLNDCVNNVFVENFLDETYFTKKEAAKAIGLFAGSDLPAVIITYVHGDYILASNCITLFRFQPTTRDQIIYVNSKIVIKTDDKIYFYKTRISKKKFEGSTCRLIPKIFFSGPVIFRENPVSGTAFEIKDNFELIIKNNKILCVQGISIEPVSSDIEIIDFVQKSI